MRLDLTIGETTLDEYLEVALRQCEARDAAGDDASVVRSMAKACAGIQRVVRRAGLSDVASLVEGKNGVVNVHGEEQAALDDAAHEMCVSALLDGGRCAWIASEESEEVLPGTSGARVGVVFDPLDGSSNIECAVGVGTIFGVVGVEENSCAESVYLRPGRDMRSAGYILYGSSTILVLSFFSAEAYGGVCAFTLDDEQGVFVLTKMNMRVPEEGKVYSVNQANRDKWPRGVAAYIDEAAQTKTLRYIGSMVADVHRTLLYGGTFHYPEDTQNTSGKLRAVYECFPMAAIVERAGGAAIARENACVLDFVPESVHSRVPIHIGSIKDIERLSEILSDASYL